MRQSPVISSISILLAESDEHYIILPGVINVRNMTPASCLLPFVNVQESKLSDSPLIMWSCMVFNEDYLEHAYVAVHNTVSLKVLGRRIASILNNRGKELWFEICKMDRGCGGLTQVRYHGCRLSHAEWAPECRGFTDLGTLFCVKHCKVRSKA